MKKFNYVLAMVLFILVLSGCSGVSSSVSPGILPEEEYYVYENGELIVTASEFEQKLFIFEIEQKYNYEGRIFTTKRGIKIGSTIRELADAYKDVPARIMGSNTYEIFEMPFHEYLEKASEYNIGNKYIVLISTCIIDNKQFSNAEFEQYLKDKGIEMTDYLNDLEKYVQEWDMKNYIVNFMIEDNFVKSIIITS